MEWESSSDESSVYNFDMKENDMVENVQKELRRPELMREFASFVQPIANENWDQPTCSQMYAAYVKTSHVSDGSQDLDDRVRSFLNHRLDAMRKETYTLIWDNLWNEKSAGSLRENLIRLGYEPPAGSLRGMWIPFRAYRIDYLMFRCSARKDGAYVTALPVFIPSSMPLCNHGPMQIEILPQYFLQRGASSPMQLLVNGEQVVKSWLTQLASGFSWHRGISKFCVRPAFLDRPTGRIKIRAESKECSLNLPWAALAKILQVLEPPTGQHRIAHIMVEWL